MPKIPEVSLKNWKNLYDAAAEFKKLEAWETLDDDQLFGVQDPVSGEMGYTCVLGALGEMFALCIYRGAHGFDAYERTQNHELDLDSHEFLQHIDCLMAEWTDKERVEKEDNKIIKNLGLRFKGTASCPLFRSYLPYHFPWNLTEDEVLYLTFALRCASDITRKVQSNEIDLRSREGLLYCYYPEDKTNPSMTDFRNNWRSRPIYRPEPSPLISLDLMRINKIQSNFERQDSAWEADISVAPTVIADKDRPYYPLSTLVVHQESGFVFHIAISPPKDDPAQTLSNGIVEAMEKHHIVPATIYVKDEKMMTALLPLGKALNIRIVAADRLDAILEAKQGMRSFFEGEQPKKIPPKNPDPRAIEKISSNISRKLKDKDIQSEEDLDQYIGELNLEGLDSVPAPQNALEVAQNVMYDAFEEESPKKRIDLAKKALKISPDCADAYALLAEETSDTIEEARDLYQAAMEAGERSLGKEFFKENTGFFWGMIESRPYMRARAEYANCLWLLGNHEESLKHYYEMLKLNPNDNQGVRYVVASHLAELERFNEMEKLFDKNYSEDIGVEWLILKTLAIFLREKDSSNTRAALKKVQEYNKHVPTYLLGIKKCRKHIPNRLLCGSEEEAMYCYDMARKAWEKVPGALDWLKHETQSTPEPKHGRNDPCPCGSGKKNKKCCAH